MAKKLRLAALILVLLALTLSCSITPTKARTIDNEYFSFTIPDGWKTKEEVFGADAAAGQEFKGLGVQELVFIQYPSGKGQGEVFFVVASSPVATGEDLESRFIRVYQSAVPEIEDASQARFEKGQLAGYEITYRRPWGEPWWQFRDVWLEHNGMVYVLSIYAAPGTLDEYSEPYQQILDSFQFKN